MSFKDIKGQSAAIEMLKGQLRHSLISGAYLFIGPEGVGKYLVARTFAKALNCLKEGDDSCDMCPACLKIDKNWHPDIHFIETQDSEAIKIDSIRNLKKDISLKPYEAKKKVFVINDAHNLTDEASGALLKILEEPPRDSLIILVSSKPALLFKTIVSRCKILRFYPLQRQQFAEILKKDYDSKDASAHFLAYFSEGRIGRALRLKEGDFLGEKNKVIDAFCVLGKPGLEDTSLKNRQDLRIQLNILATWFRDIYLIKIGMPYSQIINLDRKAELLMFMNRYSFTELDQTLNLISDSLFCLEQNVNIKLLLSNLREDIPHL